MKMYSLPKIKEDEIRIQNSHVRPYSGAQPSCLRAVLHSRPVVEYGLCSQNDLPWVGNKHCVLFALLKEPKYVY